VLSLQKVDYALNEAVILDYFVSALWWAAKEQKFSREQLAAFYTIIHTLLDNIRGTSVTSFIRLTRTTVLNYSKTTRKHTVYGRFGFTSEAFIRTDFRCRRT